MSANQNEAPLSARGPDAVLKWIAEADIAGAHWRLMDRCAMILNAAGFTVTPVPPEALQADFAAVLRDIASEASEQWTDELDVKAECALGVLNALAALYAVEAGRPAFASVAHDKRVMLAGTMLGIQTALLDGAESGLIEDAAVRRINNASARDSGARGGEERRKAAEQWQKRARADWAAYTGKLKRTVWAKKYAGRYSKGWRVVADAIKPSAERLQEASSLQT
ncbi:MAG: hypothetical protein NT015_12545 [Alphaproteobacteria bacterium]|nr:hypothetical protein [Alphaproteobacteria bacterium]